MQIEVNWKIVEDILLHNHTVRRWPRVQQFLRTMLEQSRHDWLLPLYGACLGRKNLSVYERACMVAAIATAQAIIQVVDGIIDQDGGLYEEIGAGQAANVASFMQALSMSFAGETFPVFVTEQLIGLFADTAYGQFITETPTEKRYWQLVEQKSVPFYQRAMLLGAGDVEIALLEPLSRIGHLLGKMVQVRDDLVDALAVPATADWQQGVNLLLVYADKVDWEGKERWGDLVQAVQQGDKVALEEAQQVLIDVGAAAYALYKLKEFGEEAKKTISGMTTGEKNKNLLHQLFEGPVQEATSLLDELGFSSSPTK